MAQPHSRSKFEAAHQCYEASLTADYNRFGSVWFATPATSTPETLSKCSSPTSRLRGYGLEDGRKRVDRPFRPRRDLCHRVPSDERPDGLIPRRQLEDGNERVHLCLSGLVSAALPRLAMPSPMADWDSAP